MSSKLSDDVDEFIGKLGDDGKAVTLDVLEEVRKFVNDEPATLVGRKIDGFALMLYPEVKDDDDQQAVALFGSRLSLQRVQMSIKSLQEVEVKFRGEAVQRKMETMAEALKTAIEEKLGIKLPADAIKVEVMPGAPETASKVH